MQNIQSYQFCVPDQQQIMNKSQENKASDDPVTPIVVAKNELRLVRTEQRLDKTEQVKAEGRGLDGGHGRLLLPNDMIEEKDENSINIDLHKN